MCGIFGCFAWSRPVDEGEIAAMGERLVHRGPDHGGQWTDRMVGLGCRRLSIVDVAGGDQPFFNEDRSVVLACNGEIFNYPELRARLEPRHRFASHCDVEVLVHLYEECGAGLLHELNGQFAFALYDRRRGVLLLARDHFGICPLHYVQAEGRLLFASEIKALLGRPGVSGRLDLRGLDQALTLPAVVSPQTMFEGVRSLRPGHWMEVTIDGPVEREYWDLEYPLASSLPEGEAEPERYVEPLRETLRAAVRRRLQSDVPIGLYVSGGLDSAIVARLAAAEGDPEITHALSVGFEQSELDESAFQRLVAEGLGYPHRSVDVRVDDVCRRLEQTVWHSEVPMRESYNVASLRLSELARSSGVVVVLSGEGSDEFFAGYSGYRFDSLWAQRAGSRQVAAEEASARAALWGDPTFGYDMSFGELRARKERLYSADVRASLPDLERSREPLVDGARLRGRHVVHKRSYLDVKLRMSDHLLGDHGDRMTMASSIEGRYPFLDLDFVRVAMDVPPSLKLRGFEEKFVLKRAFEDVVPARIAGREKFPFTAPASPYLVRHANEFVRDWLSPDVVRRQGVFDPAEVDRLCTLYEDPDYRPSTPLRTDWLMLVLTFTMLAERARRASNEVTR